MAQFTPFSSFDPDSDPTTPGIITDCDNLVPTLRGYAGAPSGVDVGMSALATAAVSAAILTKLDSSNRLIAGTSTKLYEKSGNAWTDISRVVAYNASASFPWRFAQFGNTSLAVNKGDVIQASTAGIFADLVAPKAAVMCVVSGFVLVGNTNEATFGDSTNRWWCSAYLNVADWVPAIATQCTTGQLVDSPGAITAIKPFGDNVVVYKDRSMYFGQYSGPPGVWDFNLIPGEIGSSSQEAVADIGTAHIFIGYEDIYMFDGSRPMPIGASLRKWFFADLDPVYRDRIRSSHDRKNTLVYFHYPRISSAGVINGCIVYNYKTNKWGIAHRVIEAVVDYVASGYTWDTLPLTTWDSWPAVAYDSPFWTDSARYSAYVGTDHKIYSLTGVSASAQLTTGDYGTDNNYSMLSRVTLRYLTRPPAAFMINQYQGLHGGAWTTDVATAEFNGRFDVLRSAPWHRVTFYFIGNFETTAASADFQPDGVL